VCRRYSRGEGTLFLSVFKRIPSSLGEKRLLGGVGKAPRRLLGALCVVSLGWCLAGLRLLVDAILVVLVIFAPVIAIVGVLLCLHPFLGLGAVDIGLEGHGLAGGEGRGAPIANVGQPTAKCIKECNLQRRPGFFLVEAEGARHGAVGSMCGLGMRTTAIIEQRSTGLGPNATMFYNTYNGRQGATVGRGSVCDNATVGNAQMQRRLGWAGGVAGVSGRDEPLFKLHGQTYVTCCAWV